MSGIKKLESETEDHQFHQLKDESVESLLTKAGGWGPLQFKSFFFAMLALQGVNFYIYNLAYFELLPKLLCTTDGIEYHECGQMHDDLSYIDDKYAHQTEMCVDGELISENNWKVDFTDHRSLSNWMTEHKLYCVPRFYIGLLGSMYFFGFLFQGLLLKFSDYYGRLNLIRLVACLQIVITILMYTAQNYHLYYVLYFFIGVCAAKLMCLFIYINEISTQKYRMLMNSLTLMFDNTFVTIISSIYFMFGGKNWRHLTVYAPVFLIFCVILSFFVPESPKYLHAKGKYKELAVFINESARQNGTNFRVEEGISLVNKSFRTKSDDHIFETQNSQVEYSIWNDLKQTKVLTNFVITVLIFSFVAYDYFLMGFYMKYATGDVFINTLLTSISEIVAYLSAVVLLRFIGLKRSFTVCSCISIVFGIPLMFDIPIWMATVCLIFARFGAQAAFPCVHYLGNCDIFSPLFVPFLYAAGNFSAKTLTIFAPQIVELPQPIPMISFLMGSLGILICSILIKI